MDGDLPLTAQNCREASIESIKCLPAPISPPRIVIEIKRDKNDNLGISFPDFPMEAVDVTIEYFKTLADAQADEWRLDYGGPDEPDYTFQKRKAWPLVRVTGVEALVDIAQKNVFTLDVSPASVVTLYMGREVNLKLVPQLQTLKPGSRIVSHNFDIEGFEPDKVIEFKSSEDDTNHSLYLWTAPLKKKAD